LYATAQVLDKVLEFLRTYELASLPQLRATTARAAGGDDPGSRLTIGAVKDQLEVLLEDVVNAMHADVGNRKGTFPTLE